MNITAYPAQVTYGGYIIPPMLFDIPFVCNIGPNVLPCLFRFNN